MFSSLRAAVAAAAPILFAVSNVAGAESVPVRTALIEELHLWIDAETDLPAAERPAKIIFADLRDVAEPSDMASMIGSKPRGIYDPDTGTITLVRPWSADDPQDVAVLLHELVHHRQGGEHYYCEMAKEHAAYRLQQDWLAERDLALNVNWIAVVLASSCAARDIHP